MSTKAAAATREFPPTSLERIAYESVGNIPTQEANDRNRLGYHVWRWLQNKLGSIEEIVKESGARLVIPETEAAKVIREALERRGIDFGT